MSGRNDAATLLERAVLGDAGKVGITVQIIATAAARWASATFVGARHRLELAGPQDMAAGTWLNGLGDTDLSLRGHLVADVKVVEQENANGRFSAILEVLTVEEA